MTSEMDLSTFVHQFVECIVVCDLHGVELTRYVREAIYEQFGTPTKADADMLIVELIRYNEVVAPDIVPPMDLATFDLIVDELRMWMPV